MPRLRECGSITEEGKGKWPNEAFFALTEKDQQAYMRDMAVCLGREAAKNMETQICTFSRSGNEKRNTTPNGEFLPLSVWDRRGYNIQDIQDKTAAADVSSHEVLGKV